MGHLYQYLIEFTPHFIRFRIELDRVEYKEPQIIPDSQQQHLSRKLERKEIFMSVNRDFWSGVGCKKRRCWIKMGGRAKSKGNCLHGSQSETRYLTDLCVAVPVTLFHIWLPAGKHWRFSFLPLYLPPDKTCWDHFCYWEWISVLPNAQTRLVII